MARVGLKGSHGKGRRDEATQKRAAVMNLNKYAWQHASTLTEEADKRLVLEWFVERVRAGKTVNSEVMEFIAAGIEQHLAGKKPWGAKQGVKKKSVEQAMQDAFPVYAAFQRIGAECSLSGSADPAYVCVTTAEELCISEDTVKRAIAAVKEGRKTLMGKSLYQALSQYQIWLEYLKSPKGKAWLESPEGKKWQKDADT